MATPPRARPPRVALVLSDVDGTLVTGRKELTPASVEAAAALRAAGIRFAITSSRPPAGLRMLLEPLRIDAPVAAFNGGVLVAPEPGLRVLAQHLLAPDVAARAIEALTERGVGIWAFTVDRWLVRDPEGAYVDHEARTVQFGPTAVADFGNEQGGFGKIVGVSADFDLLERCEAELRALLGDAASVARSQRYYLDVTHPLANKGEAVRALAEHFGLAPAEIATLGDGFNDVAMFERAGFAIAMGNAAPAVRAAADRVSASNEEDGFAHAVRHFILGREGG